jgi:MFS family permease
MATERSTHSATTRADRAGHRRARTTGLIIAAVGIVILNVAPFLDWVKSGDDGDAPAISRTGYETDSLVPFMAYLGVGVLIALLVAAQRAWRGQHRGLTLAAMALGVAVTLQCLAFAIEPMGGLERGDDLTPQVGVWVGLIGAIIWTAGCAIFSTEIEGDDHDLTDNFTYEEGRQQRLS